MVDGQSDTNGSPTITGDDEEVLRHQPSTPPYRRTAEERRWRFNGHELVADVLAGIECKDGIRSPTTPNEKVAA